PRVQVAAHETERPIAADAAEGAKAVGHVHLAKLGERAVFDDVVVRVEHVVEAADAGALRRTAAPAVADRLCRLDRCTTLVEVARVEVEQTPALALVV